MQSGRRPGVKQLYLVVYTALAAPCSVATQPPCTIKSSEQKQVSIVAQIITINFTSFIAELAHQSTSCSTDAIHRRKEHSTEC